MSVQLLDKTRKINKLLHNNHSHRVDFNDICDVLSGILESNVLVISQKGVRLLLSALIQFVVRCLVAFCPVNNEALEGELTLCA